VSVGNLIKVAQKILEELQRLNANLEGVEVRDEITDPPQKYVNDRRTNLRKRN
jgi:hypothetical protein